MAYAAAVRQQETVAKRIGIAALIPPAFVRTVPRPLECVMVHGHAVNARLRWLAEGTGAGSKAGGAHAGCRRCSIGRSDPVDASRPRQSLWLRDRCGYLHWPLRRDS